LEVRRTIRTVAFEFNDNELARLVEREDIQSVAGVLEVRVLGGNDEQILAKYSRLLDRPLLEILSFENAEVSEILLPEPLQRSLFFDTK
jgi:hypothetical protein